MCDCTNGVIHQQVLPGILSFIPCPCQDMNGQDEIELLIEELKKNKHKYILPQTGERNEPNRRIS